MQRKLCAYQDAAVISGLSPESLLIVKNYTWQVFWLGLCRRLPIPLSAAQWLKHQQMNSKSSVETYARSGIACCPFLFTNLTATGIAPDLHRTSLLMAPAAPTKYFAKMMVESEKTKGLLIYIYQF